MTESVAFKSKDGTVTFSTFTGHKTFIEPLDCVLTEQELNEKRARVVEIVVEEATIEGEKKAANDKAKHRLEALEDELGEILQILKTGKEERSVECREYFDLDRALATTIRLDAEGSDVAVVRTRPMSPDEVEKHRQQSLL
jgi:hypothetical protein